jgi:GT2 family glycosyltransferase
MKILIVITSYRAKELTVACLESLADEVAQNPGIKVGICDNGNEDDTFDYLAEAIDRRGWQSWVYVTRVMPNRGFAGGNNVILQEALNSGAQFDYYLLLNADTIVRPGALRRLVDGIESDEEIGIACPRLEWPDGTPQISCFRYISPVSEFINSAATGPLTRLLGLWDVPVPVSETPIEMDWGSFACALIRRQVFERIGVLDEGYFLYFDDVDYCREARNAGWKVKYFPDSRVVHLRGKSNPLKELTANRKQRPAYWYVSRSWYLRKFYGRFGLLGANLLWYAGRIVSGLRELIGEKTPHVCEKEWLDIWKGFLRRPEVRQEEP